MYRVIKVLNNNGILVLDDANGQEQILLGNGVGFGHRMGERMAELPKGRRYELVSEKTPALIRVNGIDPIYIEAAGKIIEMAEAAMGPLQHDILIPMADHIAMAAARAREKKEIPNPFQHDIAALFGDEYEAARKGCEILKKMTGTALGEDEAGFIALHIHAGLAQENVADSLETARSVRKHLYRKTLPPLVENYGHTTYSRFDRNPFSLANHNHLRKKQVCICTSRSHPPHATWQMLQDIYLVA